MLNLVQTLAKSLELRCKRIGGCEDRNTRWFIRVCFMTLTKIFSDEFDREERYKIWSHSGSRSWNPHSFCFRNHEYAFPSNLESWVAKVDKIILLKHHTYPVYSISCLLTTCPYKEPGPRFNIKMISYQWRKSHCGDKTILRPSYLHNGISYTGKMTSLYWIRAQDVNRHSDMMVQENSASTINPYILMCMTNIHTIYPKKYAHGFVVLCFVVVMQSFIMDSHEVFIHIHQGCFAGTGVIVRLPKCQWSKPDGYGKISQCITTTKHSKAKTVCIFLGIYCMHRRTF